MIHTTLIFIVLAIVGSAYGRTLINISDARGIFGSYHKTCQKIANSVSNVSAVYDIASISYVQDIGHWALSSSQVAACSFEPGTPEDVGVALRILGETQTSFAVKGGGHTANPGFSSTEGVHIAMTRFSDIVYDPTAKTVTIGVGQIWDNVYAALEPHGVNVVGGRVPGVGVGGFILGGGYSWLTNQHGLSIDTVQAFEFVMANGTVVDVTETSSPDLFFALRGGMNNFGIITRFTLKVFPQTEVWGGAILYVTDVLDTEDVLEKISQATANFAAKVTDPKAAIITSYNFLEGIAGPTVIVFYDGPTPAPGVFDEFLEISPPIKDVATRSFPSFVRSLPGFSPTRAVFHSISVTDYPLSFLRQIAREASYWTKNLSESTYFINYDAEPFLPTIFDHGTTPSAYPPDRTRGLFPLEIYFAWSSADHDQVVYDAIRTSAQKLEAYAIDGGYGDANAVVYPNYAIFDTPLVKLYGANVPRLQAIKRAVDPDNVMGLAGGFKL